MTTSELLEILRPAGKSRQLTAEQKAIVSHPKGPAWVLAGPGSGKTEVLTLLVLRLLFVESDPIQDSRVPPESIFVTTFTEKAARNLADRISVMRAELVAKNRDLNLVDISKLRIGTLHGLCNDLLQEYRATNYQNVRLMDDFEQALFVHEYMGLVKRVNEEERKNFWSHFPWLFTKQEWQPHWSFPPNRWKSTKALVTLLNRLVDDRVSVTKLRMAGGRFTVLADLYEEYLQHLKDSYRCDFANLQSKFLDFLGTDLGRSFVEGDKSGSSHGIQWVLVDEYQDTNPMQEAIYFELARKQPHNLVVVGDDDQAMYRFRGGSVECMVTFDDACEAYFSLNKAGISQYHLVDNFRSHPEIVKFFSDFVGSFPVMQKVGARSPKPAIIPKRVIPHSYPAVGTISGKTLTDLAEVFASTVTGLVEKHVVNDPSECCLLLKSTKESPRNAGPYVKALQREGLKVYNPRNKAFMDQEEIQGLLGALLSILDPNRELVLNPVMHNIVPDQEAEIRAIYQGLANNHLELRDYVERAVKAIAANPGQYFACQLQELLYYLMSLDPFDSWQQDPVRRIRMAKLTKLLEAYSSMPVLDRNTGRPSSNLNRGLLMASLDHPGQVNEKWLTEFYHLFLSYLVQTGFDDDEVGDTICPLGMVPVMTMHQSKGLEFPFVFVGHLGEKASVSASHELEDLLSPFPTNERRVFSRFPASQRAEMDFIRQYYVAYSRAKYSLILLGTDKQFDKLAIPLGPTSKWVRHRILPL